MSTCYGRFDRCGKRNPATHLPAIVAAIGSLCVLPLGRPAVAEDRSSTIDDARLAVAGIRKLSGDHLVLYTDLPSRPEIDSLPAVFDKAVPLWAACFGVDPAETADWHVSGFLIGDRAKFANLGLLPDDNELIHGYSKGTDLWLFDQPTDYYRRHLLLHEGTHAFMTKFLDGCGPGWYSEGMAELLATHRLQPGKNSSDPFSLTLNIMPRDRREVPMLGRIKLVRDAVAAGDAIDFPAVMQFDNHHQLGNDAYAWCWAAAKFLDAHPRYRDRFHALQKHVQEPEFNELVRREFAGDWNQLLAEWQAYVAALDHGYDFDRMAIDFRPGVPLTGKREVTVRADRGWQSSGVRLEAGKTYHVTAHGRYQIAREETDGTERPWPCEPGGVTIQYYDGRPLGILLGAVVPDGPEGGAGFARPLAIGLGAKMTPQASGTLYLRVNDSAGRLDDNRGTLTIEIAD